MSGMRDLFLRSMGLFEVFRTLGYAADEIYMIAGSGAWHVELRHHGKSFIVTVGPLPDTHDEERAAAEMKSFSKEYLKEDGGWFDDTVVAPYVEKVKELSFDLLLAMTAKGVYPL